MDDGEDYLATNFDIFRSEDSEEDRNPDSDKDLLDKDTSEEKTQSHENLLEIPDDVFLPKPIESTQVTDNRYALDNRAIGRTTKEAQTPPTISGSNEGHGAILFQYYNKKQWVDICKKNCHDPINCLCNTPNVSIIERDNHKWIEETTRDGSTIYWELCSQGCGKSYSVDPNDSYNDREIKKNVHRWQCSIYNRMRAACFAVRDNSNVYWEITNRRINNLRDYYNEISH